MLDVPHLVALAVAWIGAFFGDVGRAQVTECLCNCTCEVNQASCPPSSTWLSELTKLAAVLLVGVLGGLGFIGKGIYWGGQVVGGWLCDGLREGERPTLKSPTLASLPADGQGGQRDLALQQLQAVRQRRANRG